MDYSKNFAKGAFKGTKNPIFPRDQSELYDLSAFGIKLPHPPTNPTKVPKDVAWWTRTNGGMTASMNTLPKTGGDPIKNVLRILRSGRKV